jgi:hypothetical protein
MIGQSGKQEEELRRLYSDPLDPCSLILQLDQCFGNYKSLPTTVVFMPHFVVYAVVALEDLNDSQPIFERLPVLK